MKRALRRFHLARMKERARKLYPREFFPHLEHPEKYANHLTVCSCYVCGNPRRHSNSRKDKVTLAEYKSALTMYEEQLELNLPDTSHPRYKYRYCVKD